MLSLAVPSAADTPSHSKIGVEERLGNLAAMSAQFLDETGNTVTLGLLVDRPTVIVPVYLSCRDVCPMLLAGVAEVLGKINSEENFRVLTISFDENDTPDVAKKAKANFLQAIGAPFPAERWNFLTGSEESIHQLTNSIGFSFKRQKEGGFAHTAVIAVLSPEGKIVRYLYGVSFLPFDLKMALTEAGEGRVGSMGRKVLLYCFSYDPEGRGYVFNILKVTGSVTLLFIVSFFIYLIVSTKRWRKHHSDNDS